VAEGKPCSPGAMLAGGGPSQLCAAAWRGKLRAADIAPWQVYAPRHESEIGIVLDVVRASFDFARGAPPARHT
jgi:hypothetical protein